MNKQTLLDQLKQWEEDGESEKIIVALISLPEEILNTDMMYILAQAYMDIDKPKKAVAVLEEMRKDEENTIMWLLRMGLALIAVAETDEECRENDELRENLLDRAQTCISRVLNMNPPDEILDSLDEIFDRIDADLGVEYDDEDEAEDEDLELYDGDDIIALEEHIKEYFGDFPSVFHELESHDIHVDVCVVPPTKERSYYTLITMGMGAHAMNIPENADPDKARAELMICLPPDWKVGDNSREAFWPIYLLKSLAHLPIESDTWLGWGHSVDNQNPYADNTEMCGSILVYPEGVESGADKCTLPSGNVVNFFQVIPIYREEMLYKIDNDMIKLLEKLQNVANHIVNINRPNCCEGYCNNDNRFDNAITHCRKVTEKNLPIEPINGCNHIAIFVRWCIEHDLMAREFYIRCAEIAEGVKNCTITDLREFVMDCFKGRLDLYQFSFIGANFLNHYYNIDADEKYYYPSDVDNYAESYFGTEKYNSEEFQDEAYLFVPFDEQYFRSMSKYIQRAYDSFFLNFMAYRKQADAAMIDMLSAELGFTGQAVYPDSDLFNKIRSGLPKRSDGISDVPILLHEFGPCGNTDEAKDVLYNALTPLLKTFILANIPDSNPLAWVERYFTETDDRAIEISDVYTALSEEYGVYPWLLTYDRDTPSEMSLFIRDRNGYIVRYVKKNNE